MIWTAPTTARLRIWVRPSRARHCRPASRPLRVNQVTSTDTSRAAQHDLRRRRPQRSRISITTLHRARHVEIGEPAAQVNYAALPGDVTALLGDVTGPLR